MTIIIIIVIILLCASMILYFILKRIQSRRQAQTTNFHGLYETTDPLMSFGWEKDIPPQNDTIVFQKPFASSPPCVFGTVVNINNGSTRFNESIISFSGITTSGFVPEVYQTWPQMGIHWLALKEMAVPNKIETGVIANTMDLVLPSKDSNRILFKTSFDTTPLVFLSQASGGKYAQDRQFGVYNVTPKGFYVTWYDSYDYADSWPQQLYYMAIHPSSDVQTTMGGDRVEIERGWTEFGEEPVVEGWGGAIAFRSPKTSIPVVLAGVCFDNQYEHSPRKNEPMNVTIDTVSRYSFHVTWNQEKWPLHGRINWVAIHLKTSLVNHDFPLTFQSYYQIEEPRPTATDQKYYFVECPILNPTETTILASPIGVIQTDASGTPLPNMVKVFEITEKGFVIQMNNDANTWPKDSGVQYSVITRNPGSVISNATMDHGVFLVDNINHDLRHVVINFNMPFRQPPKVFTSYHLMMDEKNGVKTAISKITTTYFILDFEGWDGRLYTFESPIHWVAIEDGTPWNSPPPFEIQVRTASSLKDLISDRYNQTKNPRLQSVFGFLDFDTSTFQYPNVFVNANVVTVDSVYSDFAHINAPMFVMSDPPYETPYLYPLHWLISRPSPGQPTMRFLECPASTFLDPRCTTVDKDPGSCATIPVTYLPRLEKEYFETETELAPEKQTDIGKLTTDVPVDLDGVVLCNIYLKKATLEAVSQYGCICRNSINHLTKSNGEIGGFTQWLINADFGYFSECKSMGNVLIRINSDFASTNPVTLQFFGKGYCPSFQYYIQFGTSYDQIRGPFAYDANVEYSFGRKGCGDLNVFCILRQNMEKSCEAIVYPIVRYPYDWTKTQTCGELVAPVAFQCTALVGGPENVIGDSFCFAVGTVVGTACSNAISSGLTVAKVGPEAFSRKICDQIFI